MISIILPTFNEARHGLIEKILNNISVQKGEKELIVVDSKSTDGTPRLALAHGARLISTGKRNRAERLNIGIQEAEGEILLFHHPVSLLPENALLAIEKAVSSPHLPDWGGFTHCFDDNHPILKFTSWYSGEVRAKKKGIVYLDHCIYAKKEDVETHGLFPEVDIFEDTLFSYQLRKKSKPHILKEKITTSARRFRKRGMIKHSLLNQGLKALFHAGMHPTAINKLYKGTSSFNVNENI